MEYEAGRLLYEQLGRNAVLKRTLSHGPTPYNRSALREELEKLSKAGVECHVISTQPAVVLSKAGSGATAAGLNAHEPTRNSAELIGGLERKWKPLYKEASYLQSQLEHAKDNQQRCDWAHKILDLMDQVQGHWEASDYVKEHGQLPPVVAVVPPAVLDLSDAVAVLKRRNNLRAQISKQRRNAERAGEVAAWETEVVMLDEVLKNLKK